MSKEKKRWIARILDSDTVRMIAPDAWANWRTTTDAYRNIGYKQGTQAPDSGDLLVQSPYTDYFNLTWGLAPNADMPKWRWMYRSRPEVKRGIDLKVILGVGRGFSIQCPKNREIEQYVAQLLDILHIRDVAQSAVTDALIYGQAYFEKVRVADGQEMEGEKVELAPVEKRVQATSNVPNGFTADYFDVDTMAESYERSKKWTDGVKRVDRWMASDEGRQVNEAVYGIKLRHYEAALKKAKRFTAQIDRKALFAPETGELVALKKLDPMWMRINRDSFDNVLGFVQWGLTPIPQSILAEKIVYIPYLRKSWAFESAYGTSALMPIQRHVSFLIQAEEDQKVWNHQYAKPTMVVFAGTPEKPYPVPAVTSLQNKLSQRGPTTDLVLPGDTKIEILKGGVDVQAFDKWSKYNREKIYEALGIPDVLMNLPGEMTRATSDVTLQAFIAEEEMIQEIVGEQLMKQIIEPEVRRRFGNDFAPMKIIWPPILKEDRNKQIDRTIKAVGVPFMSINEGRSESNLPPLDGPQYDSLAAQAATGAFGQPSKNPEQSEKGRTGSGEEMASVIDKTSDSSYGDSRDS
jgi:hypothetical protein